MIFLRLIEYLLMALLFLAIVSQVMWPLWKNQPTWPILRRRRVVEDKFGQVVEAKNLNELQKAMRKLRTR